MNTYLLIAVGVVFALYLARQIKAVMNRIPGEEARKLVQEGALLLDVRSPAEYGSGHIDGARNIPITTLRNELGGLPKDRPIVVYCASGMRSYTAHTMLRASGYDVRDLGPQSAW